MKGLSGHYGSIMVLIYLYYIWGLWFTGPSLRKSARILWEKMCAKTLTLFEKVAGEC